MNAWSHLSRGLYAFKVDSFAANSRFLVMCPTRQGSGSRGDLSPKLPHHRAYGSVHGGSHEDCKALMFLGKVRESKLTKGLLCKHKVHVARSSIPPRTAPVPRLVGSRTGAVVRRMFLGSIRGFPLRARVGSSVTPFPAPSSSHAACGFPALRAPAHFLSRLIVPIMLD
jgi:hypothetical protein